jgi:hypothetical protein
MMMEFVIKYWMEVVFGLALAGLSFCYKKLANKYKEQEYIREGLVAILHDRLCQSCLYFIGKGEITITELKNIERIYNAYHKLGGNGTGTELYERVKELKIIK